MRRITLVRGARQLLTLRGGTGPRRGADLRNLGLIQDGAVLIVDGRIHQVGPSRRVENVALAREAEEIDASGRVVMPGFVDSHTHLVDGPARISDCGTPGKDASDGDPLATARFIHELSPLKLEAQALHGVNAAVRHGTTTLEAKSGFGLIEANEIKILRVHSALQKAGIPLTSTFLAAQVSPDHCHQPDEYVNWLCTHMLPLLQRRKLAEFADIHVGENGFSVERSYRYLCAARELGFGLKLHSGHRPPPGAIRMAVELEISSVDYAGEVTQEEATALSQSPTIATLLPGASYHFGIEEYGSARKLIDAGVAVSLATNYSPRNSPSQNMQMSIALACGRMNMTPAEAVNASTLNAAHAMRKASSIGSLVPGKAADLLILCVPDYREIPYHFGVNQVELVMKNGNVIVERSEVKWLAR
jgi:imidazolonepropionase